MGGGWFLMRERVIMQLGLSRRTQPRGRGRGGKVHRQLFCQKDGQGRKLEVRPLVKPVSYNEDAKQWGEEAVEKLRHESNTLRGMWGSPGEADRTENRAFVIVIRSMNSCKEVMSDRLSSPRFRKHQVKRKGVVSAERNPLPWTDKAWVHKAFGNDTS